MLPGSRLDNCAPVSVYTVAKELGHGGDFMVKRIYGHLATVRHRSEIVEFRIEQHLGILTGRQDGLYTATVETALTLNAFWLPLLKFSAGAEP